MKVGSDEMAERFGEVDGRRPHEFSGVGPDSACERIERFDIECDQSDWSKTQHGAAMCAIRQARTLAFRSHQRDILGV